MIDPSQLSGAFLSGPQLSSADIDVDNDLIPYFKWDAERNEYILATVSPSALNQALVSQ